MRVRLSSTASVASIALLALMAGGCASAPRQHVEPVAAGTLQVRGTATLDTAPKEALRLVPPEVYMRTYLQLFGGLAPLDVQKRARGADNASLFDTWDDYVSALGFPDYRADIPRQAQTNALMMATFERLGVALCDRAIEHDWRGAPLPPRAERVVFAFDPPRGNPTPEAFAAGFDVLHRTFLGYPAALAPSDRAPRYYRLFEQIAAGHSKAQPRSRFTPYEAGWAAVCYGLVRHPEFHLY
jgi:hypothetical protein